MTTMELIERGIGHNCLSDAYDLGRADAIREREEFWEMQNNFAYEQGRADKYQEIVSEYMLLTEKQVAEIRADAINELPTQLYYDGWNDGYKQGRANAIEECIQIVQKIKDDYNDAKFGEQIPINYGTICGIIIALEQLKEKKNE